MANESNPIDDMYNEKQGIGSKAKKIFDKIPFKAVAKKLGKGFIRILGSAAVPVIVGIVVVVILLVIIIGVLVFIFTGPDSVRGQVNKMADDMWTSIQGFYKGKAEAQVKKEDIVQIASYLDNAGYKLEGYGFAEKGAVKRDERGKVTDVESEYITAYLVAENKTYTIANKDFNLRDYFNKSGILGPFNPLNITRVAYGLATGDTNPDWGSGMIVINSKLWSGVNADNVDIDRPNQIMSIKLKDTEGNEEIYQYNLDGWMGRYGKPIEFLLALHTGTMAPDFALQVAVDDEFDTKVYVRFKKVGTMTKLKYNGEYVFNYSETTLSSGNTNTPIDINTGTDVKPSIQVKDVMNGAINLKQNDPAFTSAAADYNGQTACAPTTFSILCYWATGKYVSPIEANRWAVQHGMKEVDSGLKNWNFFEEAARDYGFSIEQTMDKQKVIDALKAGIPVGVGTENTRKRWIFYDSITLVSFCWL